MHSTLADQVVQSKSPREVDDLLVLWQHPKTREIVPIGRLCHSGDEFTFAYTRAAHRVDGFRPLPGLSDLNRCYRSHVIPAVFGARVMERGRPDFAAYVQALGLDPAHVTPWEQIVHSGGGRAGDTLQFMQTPMVEADRATACFLVSGVRHMADDEIRRFAGRATVITPVQHELALGGLRVADSVDLVPEDENPRDPLACLVVSRSVPVGWVPRVLAPAVRELHRSGPVTATVLRVGRPDVPAHVRLVLQLDAQAPSGFEFDRDGLWEPVTV